MQALIVLLLILVGCASNRPPEMKILSKQPSPPTAAPDPTPAPARHISGSELPASSASYTSEQSVLQLISRFGFYDNRKNRGGGGVANQLELSADGQMIRDNMTGLIWQRGGSPRYLLFSETKQYLDSLNSVSFGGYSDWRMPTLAEAMTLMTPYPNDMQLHIDPAFDAQQQWIWTSEKKSRIEGWIVYYTYGYTHFDHFSYAGSFCRAVRSDFR